MKKVHFVILLIILISCGMKKNNSVKQDIRWKELNIQLLYGYDSTSIPYDAESNIIALNKAGEVVWEAEPPKTHYEQYFTISIDSLRNLLIANTGGGFQHLINLENGKIVDYYLVK